MLSILLMMPALAQQAPPRSDISRLERVAADPTPIDDATLVAFVREPFDPMGKRSAWPRTLGMHRGAPVVVSYVCSDVCPRYTRRIVRYNLLAGPDCERAGGISKDIRVPKGIGAGYRRYCIPAATERYQR